jgi:hypothetical protein
MYSDVHDGRPMQRWLCPEPGCVSVLADETFQAVQDQAWCESKGIVAPGWEEA